MTEADIGVIIAAGGSVVAGAWQTLRGVAAFLTPRIDRLIEATEATARSTAEHTVHLTELKESRAEQTLRLERFRESHEDAKVRAFENHARIEGYAKQAEEYAKRAVDLCEKILVEVQKESA